MKNIFTLILILLSFSNYAQKSYTSKSGLTFKVGDTLQLGQPLSKYYWVSIIKEGQKKPVVNRNLFNQKVVVEDIDVSDNKGKLYFTFFRRVFYLDIEVALKNKELIPSVKREFAKESSNDKFSKLKKLKELLDIEAITREEFDKEKKKILDN